MKTVIILSLLLFTFCCKEPDPPKPHPTKEVTFYFRDDNSNTNFGIKNHMLCSIGAWDTVVSLPYGLWEFKKIGKVGDTAKLYYKQDPNDAPHTINKTGIRYDLDTTEWSKSANPGTFVDSLELVIR